MRTVTIAAVIVALLAAPAYSQGMSGGKKAGRGKEQKTESKKPADDKAYKAALDRIPVPKKPYDPWQNMRPASAGAGH
jgi:hypothetical protein